MNPSQRPKPKPVLLVVDDDQNFRSLIVAAAERTGEYSEVRDAPDGQAAREMVRGELRDDVAEGALVVLSDLCMPRMDGFEFLRTLKHDPETREVPVAIMTSSNRPNDMDDAVAGGCSAFFHKPYHFEQMVAMVASVPRSRRSGTPVARLT